MSPTEKDIAVDLSNYLCPMDLQNLFHRPAPVQLEIGPGKGAFLLNQARAHPELNFLGLEWANEFYRYCADRMRRWQMTNVRILRADARDFLARCVRDHSVQTVHIYFPDPWPKRRHHKRRFFTPANALHVWRCLTPGGQLRTATDHAEYFHLIQQLLLDTPGVAERFETIAFFPPDAAAPGEWVGSNFERKYRRQGRPIYTLALRKR